MLETKNVRARLQPPSHQMPARLAASMSSQYSFSVPHRLPQRVESKALSSPDWMRVLTGNVLSST